MIETWLPVIGYEGYYEVSDLGNVYRLKAAGSRRPGYCKFYGDPPYGYLRVSLCRDGKDTLRRVHKVVAEAFLGPCPEGMEVLHGPGGKHDNSLVNLSYGTHAQNCAQTIEDGTSNSGTRHYNAVLTEEIVLECRNRYSNGGVTYKSLASEFGVSMETMWNAVAPTGRTWRHL
jgi:hypothetical protein